MQLYVYEIPKDADVDILLTDGIHGWWLMCDTTAGSWTPKPTEKLQNAIHNIAHGYAWYLKEHANLSFNTLICKISLDSHPELLL